MTYIEVCSNPECSYKTTYDDSTSPEKFCTVCGKPMIYECPRCRKPFSQNISRYCPNCGADIKKIDSFK